MDRHLGNAVDTITFGYIYKSRPFLNVIGIHLISLSYHILVILPSHFSYMEQMLM